MRFSGYIAASVVVLACVFAHEGLSQSLRRIAIHGFPISGKIVGFDPTATDQGKLTIEIARGIRASQLLNMEPIQCSAVERDSPLFERYDSAALGLLSNCDSNVDFHLIGNIELSNQLIWIRAYVYLDSRKYRGRVSDFQLFKVSTSSPPDKANPLRAIADVLTKDLELEFEQRISISLGRFRFLGKDTQFVYLEEPIRRSLFSSLGLSQRVRLVTKEASPRPDSDLSAAKYGIEGTYFTVGSSVALELSAIHKETAQVVHSVKGLLNMSGGEEFLTSIDVLGNSLKEAIEKDFKAKEDQRIRITEAISSPDAANPISLLVVAEPPYPQNGYTENLTLDVARTLFRKLREARSVSATLFSLAELNESSLVNQVTAFPGRDALAKKTNADYLLLTRVEYPKPGMNLVATLYPVRNPLLREVTRTESVRNLDEINDRVQGLAEQVLAFLSRNALPLDTMKARLLDSAKLVMKQADFPQSVWGVRARGLVHGFLVETKKIYLGNHYRANLEFGVIHYSMPWQIELDLAYDFGKPTGDFMVYGRYVTVLLRHNWVWPPTIHNSRFWVGGGPTLVNVVRVPPLNPPGGDVVWGLTLSTGLEVLACRDVFVDINGGCLLAAGKIDGFRLPDEFTQANPTSFFVGFAVGYRW